MSCYGVLLNPGPGDTLRFLHGFCELLREKCDTGIVFCTTIAFHNISELFSATDRKISLIECYDFHDMNQRLITLPSTTVWYCYDINYIDRTTKKLPEIITHGTTHEYYMIDRYDNHKYMCGKISEHLLLPEFHVQEKALLFLRNMTVRPERNMNNEILNAIVELFNEYKIDFDIVGRGTKEWDALLKPLKAQQLFSHGYPDYLSQIKTYGTYFFAIGMNSGGLDLAFAAGVPGVRVGEFHQYYSWLGANYNDFLSSRCTINIASNSETDVSNIDKAIIEKAVDTVFNKNDGIIWL